MTIQLRSAEERRAWVQFVAGAIGGLEACGDGDEDGFQPNAARARAELQADALVLSLRARDGVDALLVRVHALLVSRIPTCARSDQEPFSTCKGCGAQDGAPCEPGCWVLELEAVSELLDDRIGPMPATATADAP